MDPLPNLLCKEDDSFLTQHSDDDKNEKLDFCFVSESDCDYMEMLIRREPLYGTNRLKNDRSSLKCARSEAIKWILDTRALFGYHYRTAYLSLIYFDCFFSRVTVADEKYWAIRLLSVACLSLAAKVEESEVKLLSEYHVDGYNFNGFMVQKMELLVLSTLGWNMNYATPFAYLKYFAFKFCGESRHNELINRADELILAVMEEINIVETRSSIVAAAAILAAYDHELMKDKLDTKMNLIPLWSSVDKEHMFSCYTLFQANVRLKAKKRVSGAKRGLTFVDGDQYCPRRKR